MGIIFVDVNSSATFRATFFTGAPGTATVDLFPVLGRCQIILYYGASKSVTSATVHAFLVLEKCHSSNICGTFGTLGVARLLHK